MPSEKRARQRALRAEKQAIIQKHHQRRKTLRRSVWGAIIIGGIVLIVVLIQVSGNPPKKAAGTTSTTKAATTTTTTFPVPSTVPLTSAAVEPKCAPKNNTKRVVWFKKAPPACIKKSSVWDATFDTSVGDFTVKMDAASSFAAVNNFVFLAEWDYFNGTFFHRIIPGFVVQGGDPTGTGSGGTHQLPGYSYTGNTPPKSCTTKPTQAACYHVGDIAMANTSGPKTNGSQFFLVLPGGQTTLNKEPNYTDFGTVVSGLATVEKLGTYGTSAGTPTTKVYLLKVTLKQVKA